MKGLDFTRADLVVAQDVFGIPAPYIMGEGTQRNRKCQENDLIPLHESTSEELQLDLFYFLGQVFSSQYFYFDGSNHGNASETWKEW